MLNSARVVPFRPSFEVLQQRSRAKQRIADPEQLFEIQDFSVPRESVLTPNTEVSYVMAFPDLQTTGRLVLDHSAT